EPMNLLESTRPDTGEELLAVEDLRISYRRRRTMTTAVDGVSFSIRRGESLALVGESGSGKSSIARAVLGLLGGRAEVSGRVRFVGGEEDPGGGEQDLLAIPTKQARRIRGRHIAYVPQDPGSSLDPLRRVIDQVIEPLRHHRIG